jgi:histidyl-tRNA synthetase
MANIFQAPRGTMDVLPGKIDKWLYLEKKAADTAHLFGFEMIRFPTFEDKGLFTRGVGETTDVVQKEMFTVTHAGGKNEFALRPEGTASTVRLLLENGLKNEPMPQKLFYLTSCFRGERPQAGRLREFHQFGVEMFGAEAPSADVEVILLARAFFEAVGLSKLRLEINSIGCPQCRKTYQQALHDYFSAQTDALCDTCKDRLERNPMRILDCKSPECHKIAEGAPKVLDFICDDCRAHFDAVGAQLTALGIAFTVNPSIVRGLDYYTRTVFEFIDENQGLTLCGGGRYDGLVEQLGGAHLPALGFGLGLERLLIAMEAAGCPFPDKKPATVYFASIGDTAAKKAAALALRCRAEGFSAEYDLLGRSVKSQMKYADKKEFVFTVVIGDNELAQNSATLKQMKTGDQTPVTLDDTIVDALYHAMRQGQLGALEEACETLGD